MCEKSCIKSLEKCVFSIKKNKLNSVNNDKNVISGWTIPLSKRKLTNTTFIFHTNLWNSYVYVILNSKQIQYDASLTLKLVGFSK